MERESIRVQYYIDSKKGVYKIVGERKHKGIILHRQQKEGLADSWREKTRGYIS